MNRALAALIPRQIARRWQRAALIVVSIALGVATLVSTQLLNRCIAAAAQDSAAPAGGGADFTVGNGYAGVDRSVVARLRQVPGVRAARPLVFGRVTLPDRDDRSALVLGAEFAAADTTGLPAGVTVAIKRPAAFLASVPAVLGVGVAGDDPPATLAAVAGGRRVSLAVAGTLRFDPDPAGLNASVITMPFDAAATLLGRPGIAGRIDVTLDPGADRAAVRAALQAAVGDAARVTSPGERADASQDAIAGIKIGLAMCGAGALVVGLFLVANTLAVTVTERRREIGILRSVGATRGQVAGLFALEAAVLGVVGAAVGVPFGVGLAAFALGPMRDVLNDVFVAIADAPLDVPPSVLFLCGLAGVVTALAASAVPAWQATTDEPAEAVRRTPAGSAKALRRLHGIVSVTLIVAGVALSLSREALPLRVGSYGGVVFGLTGLLLAAPLLAASLAGVLQPVVARLPGVAVRLAADNLLRSPGRTGVVVGAQAAGVALMVQIAGVGLSNERPVMTWITRSLTPDLFVAAGDFASATNATLPLDPSLIAEVSRLPGVRAVVPLRFRRPEFRDTTVLVMAVDTAAYHAANAGLDLPGLDLFPLLQVPNTALISDNFATLHGTKVGDTISLPGPRGPVRLRVVGTLDDLSWNRGTVFIDRGTDTPAFGDDLVDLAHVYLDPARRPEGDAAVRAWAGRNAVIVTTRDDVIAFIASVLRRLYTLLYLQQGVVGIVSALGVAAALSISVLQRRREIGLLRSVGATRGQILLSVLAEAGLMGVLGTILGAVTGVALEWYVLHVIIWEEAGLDFPVQVPWVSGGVIAAAGLLLATLAGLVPAVRAARGGIAEAVAWE